MFESGDCMIGMLLGEILLASIVASSGPYVMETNYIDADVTRYNSVVAPIDEKLGNGNKIEETGKKYNSIGTSKPSFYTQQILYKYPNTISAPLDVYGDKYLSLNSGSSVQLSYSQTKSVSQTYSLQVSTSISETLQGSVKIQTGLGSVKAEASASRSIGFTGSIANTITDNYTSTFSYGESINFVIDKTGTYRLETRAMFDVYIVEYVTGVYDVKRVGNKYVYTDTIAYYTIETSYILSYIKGTDSLGLFKYNWNSTTNKYDLDQDYGRELFGSSNINFID